MLNHAVSGKCRFGDEIRTENTAGTGPEYRPDCDESGMWKKMKVEIDSAVWSLSQNA